MEKTRIHEFINEYANAVLKIDLQKIASHFHNYFVLSTQEEYWHIANNDEFLSNLEKSFVGYKKIGMDACNLLKLEIVNFKSNHYIANLEWGLFDKNRNLLTKFDISYCIKEIDNNFRFIFVIDHNENERIEEYQRNKTL